MRKLFAALLTLTIMLSMGACGKEPTIHASSEANLFRSVKMMKRRLPLPRLVEFEVAFWSLKKHMADEAAFRAAVDGKTVAQVIEQGKAEFTSRKAANDPEYARHESWETMIEALVTEREAQELPRERPSAKDQANTIQSLEGSR